MESTLGFCVISLTSRYSGTNLTLEFAKHPAVDGHQKKTQQHNLQKASAPLSGCRLDWGRWKSRSTTVMQDNKRKKRWVGALTPRNLLTSLLSSFPRCVYFSLLLKDVLDAAKIGRKQLETNMMPKEGNSAR